MLPDKFVFPNHTLSSLVVAWYCGNQTTGIPPYKVLRAWDVNEVKGMKQKLTHMRKLMKQVEKAARIVNLPHLVKKKMTEKEARFLYTSTRHLFLIPSEENKTRRYETLSWKSYYNLLSKRKWRLFGEKSEVPVEQGETVKQRK